MIANTAGSLGKAHFGRPYCKVPTNFFELVEPFGHGAAAMRSYIALGGYAHDVSRLAFMLVATVCARIGMNPRNWKRGTRALADSHLIQKGKFRTHVRGTIAYKIKPFPGTWAVGVDGQTDWIDDQWTFLHTDLAWESFSETAWKLLLRMAYKSWYAKTTVEWANEVGATRAMAMRAMSELVASGWVQRADTARRGTYQVNPRAVSNKVKEGQSLRSVPTKSTIGPTHRDHLHETAGDHGWGWHLTEEQRDWLEERNLNRELGKWERMDRLFKDLPPWEGGACEVTVFQAPELAQAGSDF